MCHYCSSKPSPSVASQLPEEETIQLLSESCVRSYLITCFKVNSHDKALCMQSFMWLAHSAMKGRGMIAERDEAAKREMCYTTRFNVQL